MNNKPKFDPGWNDPPMLNYNASNPPPKSRIANKRVGFPLDSTSNISNPVSPKPLNSIPPLPSTPSTSLQSKEVTRQNVCELLSSEEAKQNFNKIWNAELPDRFYKIITLMMSSLTSNDKNSANLHKQTLIVEYKTFCDGWVEDIKF